MTQTANEHVKALGQLDNIDEMSELSAVGATTLKNWFASEKRRARFDRLHDLCALQKKIDLGLENDIRVKYLIELLDEIRRNDDQNKGVDVIDIDDDDDEFEDWWIAPGTNTQLTELPKVLARCIWDAAIESGGGYGY